MRVLAVMWSWVPLMAALILVACPKPQPAPVPDAGVVEAEPPPPPPAQDAGPPIWMDAAPAPQSPCQVACDVIATFCSAGKAPGCAKTLADLASARAVKNPQTKMALTCSDAMTPAVVAALKWTCDGGAP